MTNSRSRLALPTTQLLLVLALVLGLCGGVSTTTAPPAQAHASATTRVQALASASTRVTALRKAASKMGNFYLWGGTGPYRFDCSGLTQWAYRRAGKRLPRTAIQQYYATVRVSKARVRPGDLVFFPKRGQVNHVGMYVAGGRILHAPKTGYRIKVSRIWTRAVIYKRVR